MTEHEAYIALNMVPAMGGTTARAGIAAFGSAAAFLQAGAGEMVGINGIGRIRASSFREAFQTVDPALQIAKAKACSVRIITPDQSDWPHALDGIPTPPLALYVAGSVEALRAQSIAIVGTRAPTLYGREQARSFSYRLCQSGLCIVSGLARGIDTEAAEGALLAKGLTVAVIGAALDRLYPPENGGLARRIVASGGAIISEYPFGRGADRQTFPMRNRLISGLARGVLCIEAGQASGTLITADHALEQGRPVMALPGRVTDPTARGCHKLIKNGARLVESAEEVLDELSTLPLELPKGCSTTGQTVPRLEAEQVPSRDPRNPPRGGARGATPALDIAPPLSVEERKIVDAVRESGEIPADMIVARSGIPANIAGPMLFSLEMKCILRRNPAGLYSLRRK